MAHAEIAVRIVLDIMTNIAVPAMVSFVPPLAQFTPKQLETVTEWESHMLYVRERIAAEPVTVRTDHVKTSVHGTTWVRQVGGDDSRLLAHAQR